MSKIKIIETVSKAVTAIIDAIMSIIKFLGYIDKIKPKPA